MKQVTIIIAVIMAIFLINENKEELIIIPNEAIRVRVIANSDKEEDIKVKENVKDDLNKIVEKILKNAKTLDEARVILKENIPNITDSVEKSLLKQNYSNGFTINYGLNYFPKKEFKGVKYTEGYYESLVVTIGEGKGSNYWCVLYPPLCSIESNNNSEVEYRSYIKDILNKYF